VTAEAVRSAPVGEAGFRLLADQLPDLIILAFDRELVLWAATGGGLRGNGWTPEHFVGLRLPQIAGSDRAGPIEACARAALGGECTELEMPGYEDPAQLWWLTVRPLVDAAGAVSGGMVLCREVTEQRRAEQLLWASQRRLTEAQRIAQIGSWEWEVAGDELAVSEEMARILGLEAGSRLLMRDVVMRFVHPGDLDRVPAIMERAPTDPTPFAFEHRIVRGDATVWSVLVRGEGVVDEDGRVVRFIGTDQDITNRRRADAERRLLGRVHEAQEGQDRRLAADLHDGHVQSLAAIGFKLEQARLRLGPAARPRSTSCSGRSPRTCRPR
jgi:PAS domain S-box-containing protein